MDFERMLVTRIDNYKVAPGCLSKEPGPTHQRRFAVLALYMHLAFFVLPPRYAPLSRFWRFPRGILTILRGFSLICRSSDSWSFNEFMWFPPDLSIHISHRKAHVAFPSPPGDPWHHIAAPGCPSKKPRPSHQTRLPLLPR